MNILFTASQETCLENIIEIQKTNLDEGYKFSSTFLSHNNINQFSTYSLSKLKKLNLNIKKLQLPSFFNKNNQQKFKLIKRYFIYFYNYKLISNLVESHNAFIFSPGGFLEHKIAYKFKKRGKKTIMIEGGIQSFSNLELNQFERSGKKISKKIKQIFKLNVFKFLNINDPYQEVDHLVVTGKFSKTVWSELGIEKDKILDIGVPRYKSLCFDNNILNKPKNIAYATGSYIFHNDFRGEEDDLNNIIEIHKLLKKKKLLNVFNIIIHPRDNFESDKISYIKSMHLNMITKDSEYFSQNSLLLSRQSSMIYEQLKSKSNAYFYKPYSFRKEIPHNEFTIQNEEHLDKVVNMFLKDELFQDFELANDVISETTYKSTNIILNNYV